MKIKDRLVKIPGQENVFRDVQTGAILFDNESAIQTGKKIKERRKAEREKLENLEKEVLELKVLLKQLIEKGSD